jgi:L-cysteine/cystine lyase
VVAPFSPELERLAAVRDALPALAAGIYLNTGSLGPIPAESAAAMAEVAERELRVGRAHVDGFPESLERMAEARAAVAAVLTTDPAAIAITHSATDGINAVAAAIDWTPGDVAVTASLEHPGGLGPLYALRARGIETRFVDIGGGDDDERTLRAFDAALTGRVRLLIISHVAWTTGAILPVAALVDLAHQRGALVVVDGAQSAGAIAVDVEAIGADAYAIAGQKWLLGPEGMGALAVRADMIERLTPRFASYRTQDAPLDIEGSRFWSDARRFEWSGYHRPSVVGMARAIGWMSMFVGLPWIYERGAAMARLAARRLAAIEGVTVLTPMDQMATLVTFRIAGWPALAALTELGARTFAIARTIDQLDALRISVGFFTSEEELEVFAQGVELLAAHTPETIPPRRTLTMLGDG